MASFLAAFMTMDGHFFHGETTRTVLEGLYMTTQAAQTQVLRWTHIASAPARRR